MEWFWFTLLQQEFAGLRLIVAHITNETSKLLKKFNVLQNLYFCCFENKLYNKGDGKLVLSACGNKQYLIFPTRVCDA